MHPTWKTCAGLSSFKCSAEQNTEPLLRDGSIGSIANAEDSNSYKQTGGFNEGKGLASISNSLCSLKYENSLCIWNRKHILKN